MRSLGIISGLFLQKDFTRTKCKQSTFIQMFLYAQKALKANEQLSLVNNIKSKQTNKPSLINNIKSKQAILLRHF